jgi:hypothetical protein
VPQGIEAEQAARHVLFTHTRFGPHCVLNWQVFAESVQRPARHTWPAVHWLSAVHAGCVLTVQVPLMQTVPFAQSALIAQWPGVGVTSSVGATQRPDGLLVPASAPEPPRQIQPRVHWSLVLQRIAHPRFVHVCEAGHCALLVQDVRDGGLAERQPTPSQ